MLMCNYDCKLSDKLQMAEDFIIKYFRAEIGIEYRLLNILM
jgi:hypothetical protein